MSLARASARPSSFSSSSTSSLACSGQLRTGSPVRRPPQMPARTENRRHAEKKSRAEARGLAAASAAHPFQPTYLPAKRGAGRPSTPKGVGREAPLTAARRRAKSLGRSAGQGTSGEHSRGGQGCGRTRGPGVHSPLALCCGWRRPSAADHAHTPSGTRTSGVRSWSAAEGLMGPGERDGCERGAGYRRGSGDCGGGDEGKTKAGRSVVLLRLGVGWWS